MSIIYNALKKTQQEREQQKPPKKKPSVFSLKNLLIFSIMVLVSETSYYVSRLSIFHRKTPVVVVQAKPKIQLTLSGVFISDKNKVAMINQKFYGLGAMINDMKIVAIDNDKILLEGKDHTKEVVKLTT